MTRGAWPGISNSDQFFYDFDFLIVLTVSHFPVFFFLILILSVQFYLIIVRSVFSPVGEMRATFFLAKTKGKPFFIF